MPLIQHGYRIDGYVAADNPHALPMLKQTGSMVLPPQIDLSPMCSPVEDQGTIGSCTANAVVGSIEYQMLAAGQQLTDLSRLFLYYNARRMSDREDQDSGTSMPHAMASLLAYGACPEAIWPYDKARWSMRPPEEVYNQTVRLPDLHYARVGTIGECKYILATGVPIIFAMGVPDQAMMVVAAQTGILSAPANGQWEVPNGAHAMLIVGYDDAREAFLVRNSWGTKWGMQGHMWADYSVIAHYGLPDGFWAVGPLDRNRLFEMQGPSTAQVQQAAVAAAPPSIQNEINRFRQGVRETLESRLQDNKKGFRDRLRGPGVGGGYEKGPGAGGGYDD